MKRALICALVSLLAMAAFGQTKQEFVAFLTKMEPQASKAFADKNIKFFDNATVPEFTYTDFAGNTQKKKDSLASMTQMFAGSDKIKAFMKRGEVKVTGATGIVVYENTYHLTMKPGPDKKVHIMTAKGKTKETWKKVGSTWKIVSIVETTAGTVLMNGKPIGG